MIVNKNELVSDERFIEAVERSNLDQNSIDTFKHKFDALYELAKGEHYFDVSTYFHQLDFLTDAIYLYVKVWEETLHQDLFKDVINSVYEKPEIKEMFKMLLESNNLFDITKYQIEVLQLLPNITVDEFRNQEGNINSLILKKLEQDVIKEKPEYKYIYQYRWIKQNKPTVIENIINKIKEKSLVIINPVVRLFSL